MRSSRGAAKTLGGPLVGDYDGAPRSEHLPDRHQSINRSGHVMDRFEDCYEVVPIPRLRIRGILHVEAGTSVSS
jgi:hypothetical protein